MITLPITCKQLLYILLCLPVPIYLLGSIYNNVILAAIGIVGVVFSVSVCIACVIMYYIEHPFPIQCKCDGGD